MPLVGTEAARTSIDHANKAYGTPRTRHDRTYVWPYGLHTTATQLHCPSAPHNGRWPLARHSCEACGCTKVKCTGTRKAGQPANAASTEQAYAMYPQHMHAMCPQHFWETWWISLMTQREMALHLHQHNTTLYTT
jgi:hypothetical protein